jgi:hypothetical protein
MPRLATILLCNWLLLVNVAGTPQTLQGTFVNKKQCEDTATTWKQQDPRPTSNYSCEDASQYLLVATPKPAK